MIEVVRDIYQFPAQQFFGEPVHAYAIEQENILYCFDIPRDSKANREFLRRFDKPIRIIMSHGSTSNGFESTRDSLRTDGLDAEIWLHEADRNNPWLSVDPDKLIVGDDAQISEDLTLIFTPGHTAGSVCLYANIEKGVIFTGDTLGGTISGDIRSFALKSNELPSRVYFQSLRKLSDYRLQLMLPFHYDPIIDAGAKLFEFINVYDR